MDFERLYRAEKCEKEEERRGRLKAKEDAKKLQRKKGMVDSKPKMLQGKQGK